MSDELHRPTPTTDTSHLEISRIDNTGSKVLITPETADSADAWLTTDILCNAEDYR